MALGSSTLLRSLCRVATATGIAVALTVPAIGTTANAAPADQVTDPASIVNPFIGTTNKADDFPGADAPFGMVEWSPDTPGRPDGGGYEYKDSSITGFSLTHLSGPGCPAGGDFPVLPTTGAVDTSATDGFSHANESANAGYYSVKLNNGITTQLTATERSGMARFTFPASNQANLIFKLNGSATKVLGTSWKVVSDTELSGSVTTGHFCGASNTYTVYFDMVFDHPFHTSGTANGAAPTPNAAPKDKVHGLLPGPTAAPRATGPGDGYVTFDTTKNQVVQAKVGLSYVSTANAAANRAAENPGWGFAATQKATHNAWNAMLNRIRITGGTRARQQVFYTALYHSLLHPNVFSDVNGQYIGFDNKVHAVGRGRSAEYANFSGWDIYRTQAQLSALVAPRITSDIAQSMVDDYAQGGMLPKWAQNNGESYIMVGDPADPIIADYYAFGARDFDTKAALRDMVTEASKANNIRPGLNDLNAPGYLPSDGTYHCCNFYGPVSTQLEYDSADFSLSALAGALGDKPDQAFFAGRAQNWRNTFNPSSGFMQPRQANGSWAPLFDPAGKATFVEGTSWQYTGMVPFNIAGLTAAKGGKAAMINYLDKVLAGFHGGNGDQADLGNEPSLYLPWEYDYLGEPYQTQKIVREVQDQIWSDSPGGLAGNDDLGEMSAWFVFSALGMYPETPGTADLALGSPLFNQTVVTLPSGRTLTINAPKAADNAPYVQSATWNGTAWANAYAPTSAITSGGTLNYTLGTSPNKSWATSASSAPPSYSGTVPKIGPITSAIAGDCVDVKGSGTADSTHIQLWTCNQSGAQKWYLAPDGTVQAQGGCMDVQRSGTANGTVVQLYECNGSGAQQWKAGANGSLVNPESGRCLDDPGNSTSTGTQLVIHDCDHSTGEHWTLS